MPSIIACTICVGAWPSMTYTGALGMGICFTSEEEEEDRARNEIWKPPSGKTRSNSERTSGCGERRQTFRRCGREFCDINGQANEFERVRQQVAGKRVGEIGRASCRERV